MVSIIFMVTLSIILLTYNSEKYIKPCIESLVKKYQVHLKRGDIEIIIADNFSTDDTALLAKKIASEFDSIFLVRFDKNYGFAKGINKASSHARGEFLLFLNPDTEFLEGDFLKMAEYMRKHENVAITSGRIIDYGGKQEPSAGKIYTLPRLLIWAVGLEETVGVRKALNTETSVEFVSGGCMMVRRINFEEWGGFDEKLFMYMEDMEFCYRVKKMNKDIFFLPYATIKHRGQGSGNKAFAIAHIYKGILFFYKKQFPSQYIFAKTVLLLKAYVIIILSVLLGKRRTVRAYRTVIQSV